MTATEFLPHELVVKIQNLVKPDIAEMKGWGNNKIIAAKEAGVKMQSEEAQNEAANEFFRIYGDSD